MNKSIITILTFICILAPTHAYCIEDTAACGKFLGFDTSLSRQSNGIVVVFEEMDSFRDELAEYQRRLPYKVIKLKISKNLPMERYIEIIEFIIGTFGSGGMCIEIRRNEITSVVAGS